MARTSTEDSWWLDPRRAMLTRLVGEEDRADGVALKLWRLAQDYWKRDRQLIPKRIFRTLRYAQELIDSGLAEEREEYIYVRGSAEYLDWTCERQAAGRRGGLRAAEAKNKKAAQPNANQSQPNPNQTQANVKQTQANTEQSLANASKAKQTLPSDSDSDSDSKEEERESTALTPSALLDLWNKNRGQLAGANGLSKKRMINARARISENPEVPYWTEIIKRLAGSSFCRGENGRSWRATFDFLLKPDTHLKVSEGQYDNGASDRPKFRKITLEELE